MTKERPDTSFTCRLHYRLNYWIAPTGERGVFPCVFGEIRVKCIVTFLDFRGHRSEPRPQIAWDMFEIVRERINANYVYFEFRAIEFHFYMIRLRNRIVRKVIER
ncbi:hypothetical protein Trydic_g17369 [Trypoxylus dichotomus]